MLESFLVLLERLDQSAIRDEAHTRGHPKRFDGLVDDLANFVARILHRFEDSGGFITYGYAKLVPHDVPMPLRFIKIMLFLFGLLRNTVEVPISYGWLATGEGGAGTNFAASSPIEKIRCS